jgi:tRNA G18 (ribose-2'-O)-methylase SpoU
MYIYGKNVIKEAIYNKRKIFSLFVEKQHKDISIVNDSRF